MIVKLNPKRMMQVMKSSSQKPTWMKVLTNLTRMMITQRIRTLKTNDRAQVPHTQTHHPQDQSVSRQAIVN